MRRMNILLMLLLTVGSSPLAYSAGSQPKSEFGFTTGSQGTGLVYSALWDIRPKTNIGVEVRFFDIKNEGEMPVFDYYTGQYINVDDKALILLPVMGMVKYYPFRGMIANNFLPFIAVTAGPVLSIDGDENERYFKKKWVKAPTLITPGGNLAAGVEFRFQGGTNISASVGYDIFPMGKKVDEKFNYNGLLLKLAVSRAY